MVWIGIILSVLQQFVGINVIFYYSTTLWKAVGFQEKDSLTISVATSITNILVTLVAIALVDRIGRRPILLAGSIGMALSLGTMALAFGSATGSGDAITLPGAWGPAALVAANVFVISFGASWGPLVWVLLGEIFPSRIRARALGLAAAAQWVANFAITLSFPVDGGGLAAPDLRHVRAVRGGVVLLRDVQGARDQRHVPGAGRDAVRAEGFGQGCGQGLTLRRVQVPGPGHPDPPRGVLDHVRFVRREVAASAEDHGHRRHHGQRPGEERHLRTEVLAQLRRGKRGQRAAHPAHEVVASGRPPAAASRKRPWQVPCRGCC